MKRRPTARVWLFDLDDTLHDASEASLQHINAAMTSFIAERLQIPATEADRLRVHYWRRYGATLLGLERHHAVRSADFLAAVHRLPELESRLRTSAHDRAVLRRLPGRKIVLTNAPLTYAMRVLDALKLSRHFESVISIEQMRMFGELRPKPDTRMFRHVLAGLHVKAVNCVLVEDTLVHQRAARALRLRTVWMQRYSRMTARQPKVSVHPCHKPPYVCARMNSFHALLKL